MLNVQQIAQVKGYLAQGYKQHDIAAYFGVNSGRITEVSTGKVGKEVKAAPADSLPKIKPQRFFTPTQTIAEQKEILADLIETSKINDPAKVYLITPKLAEHILNDRHGANRSVSAAKVEEYKLAMETNMWPVTGSTIVFGRLGRLIDGQHRLLACVQSKKAFHSYVVFGIDESAFTLIDIGRRRTNLHAFQIAGIKNASLAAKATRWLMIFDVDPTNRSIVFSNEDTLNYYESAVDKNLLDGWIVRAYEIEKAARTRGDLFSAGPLSALLYMFAKKNPKKTQEFSDRLLTRKGVGATLFTLIKKARGTSGGAISEIYRNAITIKAWNHFSHNKEATGAKINFTNGDEFPKIM